MKLSRDFAHAFVVINRRRVGTALHRSRGKSGICGPRPQRVEDPRKRALGPPYSPLIKPASINSRLKRRDSAPPAQA